MIAGVARKIRLRVCIYMTYRPFNILGYWNVALRDLVKGLCYIQEPSKGVMVAVYNSAYKSNH
jgi:hypothetical protein